MSNKPLQRGEYSAFDQVGKILAQHVLSRATKSNLTPPYGCMVWKEGNLPVILTSRLADT